MIGVSSLEEQSVQGFTICKCEGRERVGAFGGCENDCVLEGSKGSVSEGEGSRLGTR